MKSGQINKQQVVDYYNFSEIDYKLLWNLDKSLALHYGFWDSKVQNLPQALERENEILSKIAKIKKSDVVLDAGCGVGGSSIYLAKNIGCRVVGITLSPKQQVAAKLNAKRAGVEKLTQFYIKDYTKTGFKNNSFDVVWAIESVCYAPKKEKFIKEAFRILKKGGRLVVADFFTTKNELTDREEKLMSGMAQGWALDRFESSINFKKFMIEAGFKNISMLNITKNILPSAKRLYYFSLIGLPVGKLLEWLKFRNKVHTGNIWAVYYQWKALQKNLWHYCIFSAEK